MLKKNVYITGANGQDAKIIYEKLANNKKFNLFFFSRNQVKNFKQNICKVYKINDKCENKLQKIFNTNKPDIIYHLGANNPSYSQKNKKIFYSENFNYSKLLLNQSVSANCKVKFIFSNSSQIFKKKNGIVTEASEYLESSEYTSYRIKFHKYAKELSIRKNFKYINVILFNHDSIYRNKKFLLPRLIHSIKKKKLKFINDIAKENISGDFSHAEDICDGLLKIGNQNKHLKNIILSSGKKTYVNNIIKFLIKKNNLKIKVKYNFKKNSKCIIGNNKQAKIKLNWRPKKNILVAAQEIYDSFKY